MPRLTGEHTGVQSWLLVRPEPCRGLAVGVDDRLSLHMKDPNGMEAAFGGSPLRIGSGEFLCANLEKSSKMNNLG